MILTCPNCATRYQADAAKFQPAGRKVRCAKCAHTWHQPAPGEAAPKPEPEPQPVPEAVSEPAPQPVPEGAAESVAAPVIPAQPDAAPLQAAPMQAPSDAEAAFAQASLTRWRIGALSSWAALLAVVALLGFVVVEARTEIAALWPKTATFYRAVGLDVNTMGLTFQDVSYRITSADDQPILHLKGRVLNITKKELAVPQIHASLTDDARRELYDWKIDPAARNLKPGESTTFSARLPSPPAGARHVDLKFVKG